MKKVFLSVCFLTIGCATTGDLEVVQSNFNRKLRVLEHGQNNNNELLKKNHNESLEKIVVIENNVNKYIEKNARDSVEVINDGKRFISEEVEKIKTIREEFDQNINIMNQHIQDLEMLKKKNF